jgi:hypothetical protein
MLLFAALVASNIFVESRAARGQPAAAARVTQRQSAVENT